MSDTEEAQDGYVVRLPRRLIVRALMVITASVFLLVVLLLVFAIGPRMAQKEIPEPEPFCCPSDGRHIVAVVNDSVDPCEDLYSYICTSTVTNEVEKPASLLEMLEAMITTATAANGSSASASLLSKSRAGMFLQKLYAACVVAAKGERQRDEHGRGISFLSAQMASALWDSGKELLTWMNSTNLLTYLFITNLRYRIRSVVEIVYTSWDTTLLFSHDALDWGSEMHLLCEECVAAALIVYHQHVNSSLVGNGDFREAANGTLVTFDDVSVFATRLHRLYSKKKVVGHFVMDNVSQLWPAEDILNSLQVLPWLDSSANVNFECFALNQIVVLRSEITKRENWAVGAVYLIAHTVARAFMSISPEAVKEVHCVMLTTTLRQLVSATFWELYGTPEKETVIADIYKSVLDAVALDVSRHIASSGDQNARLRLSNVMGNVTLVTAAVTNAKVGQIPQETDEDYARSLLVARSFEFEAWKNRMALGLPTWFTEKPVLHTRQRLYLEVPASFYGVVHVTKGPSPLNMAVLGVRVAEILWRVVLLEEWDGEAQVKVDALLRCFSHAFTATHVHDHRVSGGEHAIAVSLAATSLALRSVMRAALVQDWYTTRDVGGRGGATEASPSRLSHAQFFFLEEAYARCPRGEAKWPDARCFNVPAAYVPEFKRAFECPHKESADTLRTCAMV
ncbi:uncharacterized protein [Dermacentor albipictus]|uniref:uncharacterized protein n=1 Tax=Dermacentor albipictus TaxID=60249 RepID=UPI0031FD90CA